MKIITLVLLLLSCISYSQNIDFDEVSLFKNKKPIEITEYLKTKGWYLFSELEPTETTDGIIVFGLENEQSRNNDFATLESFIVYNFSIDLNFTSIEIMTGSERVYSTFLKKIDDLGYKIISTTTLENEIIQIYNLDEKAFQMKIFKQYAGTKYYSMTFYK